MPPICSSTPGRGYKLACDRYCLFPSRAEWPAESPDLNLIEACWGDVETELGEITEERLDAVESMPVRLQAVIDAGGAVTKY